MAVTEGGVLVHARNNRGTYHRRPGEDKVKELPDNVLPEAASVMRGPEGTGKRMSALLAEVSPPAVRSDVSMPDDHARAAVGTPVRLPVVDRGKGSVSGLPRIVSSECGKSGECHMRCSREFRNPRKREYR